jgi:hypothetical protein
MIDVRQIDDEIRSGLQNERDRLNAARECADFYLGRFEAYSTRPPSSAWEGSKYARSSLVMNRIVKVLTRDLYAQGPARLLPDFPPAQEWLNQVYKFCGIDAILQGADRWATVGDVAALQVEAVEGAEDPGRAVRVVLWPADQFCVWTGAEDPLTPVAVATLDRYDNRRRLRLWTAETLTTYTTTKLAPGQTAGGTAYEFVDAVPNPYGLLPFAFVHFEHPTTDFWSGGIGTNLRDLNDYVNYYLTESGDSLRYCGKPIIKAFGVRAGWRPNTPIRPGDIWDLPAEGMDAAGNGIPPDVAYLQPEMGFVDAGWLDLQNFLDHSLETYGVPPAAIRMVQDAARSGVSIVAEQIPLLKWAQSRQRPFSCYEHELARVVLGVGARYLGLNGVPSDALAAAARDSDLNLRWPNLLAGVVDEAQDARDARRLQLGLTSRIQLIMRDQNCSRAEAIEALEQIAEDRALEEELLGPDAAVLGPMPPAAGGDPEAEFIEEGIEGGEDQA